MQLNRAPAASADGLKVNCPTDDCVHVDDVTQQLSDMCEV